MPHVFLAEAEEITGRISNTSTFSKVVLVPRLEPKPVRKRFVMLGRSDNESRFNGKMYVVVPSLKRSLR